MATTSEKQLAYGQRILYYLRNLMVMMVGIEHLERCQNPQILTKVLRNSYNQVVQTFFGKGIAYESRIMFDQARVTT